MNQTKLLHPVALTSLFAGSEGPLLSMSYSTADQIPEAFRPLYTERDGAHVLTGVAGVKTQDDINRLTESLTKERNDHKMVRTSLGRLGGRDLDTVLADLDRIPALEAAAKGGNIDEQIAGRLQQETAPLSRTISELTAKLEESFSTVKQYQQREQTRIIGDNVGKAALHSKAIPEAIDDLAFMANAIFEVNERGEVVAKNDIPGVIAGISPEVWLTEMKRSKPYYWPASQGAGGRGGAGGSATDNPFTASNWNMTAQGQLLMRDPNLAAQYAAQAGTSVGGPRPLK